MNYQTYFHGPTVGTFALYLGIAFLFCGSVPAQTPSRAQTFTAADRAYVDSLLQAQYPADGPGAVVLVGCRGVPIYRRAVGLASIELKVPNHVGNVMAIGSISKQFAAIAIAKLVEQGKLKFSDDVRKHLPAYNTHDKLITVAQLLSHTSGIPSYTEQAGFVDLIDKPMQIDSLVALFERADLLFEPGTDWSYSNSGYVLAARIVEVLSGKGFNDYLQTELFDPLGMFDSDFATHERIVPYMARGYDGAGKGKYVPAGNMDWGWTYGAGQIVSTVDDMLKWDYALTTGKVVGKKVLDEAFASVQLVDGRAANYAYGWSTAQRDGLTFRHHGGAVPGFLAYEISVPERELYVVVLSNNGSSRPTDVAKRILLRALGISTEPAAVVMQTPAQLGGYAGVFVVHRIGSRLASNMSDEPVHSYVRVRNDTLRINYLGDSPKALVSTGPDIFRPLNGYTRYHFRRDAKGQVNRLDIYDDYLQYGPREEEPLSALPLPAEKVAITLSAAALQKFVGSYAKGSLIKAEVVAEATGLLITIDGDPLSLKPADATHFFDAEEGVSVRFEPVAGGGYDLVLEGVREWVLERM